MDGSVACVARRLASSALRRQMSLSDDIRGGSSNAPNREEKAPPGDGAKEGSGARHATSPTPSRSRANTSELGRRQLTFGDITLSGMTRCHPRVVPSPDPPCASRPAGSGRSLTRAREHPMAFKWTKASRAKLSRSQKARWKERKRQQRRKRAKRSSR